MLDFFDKLQNQEYRLAIYSKDSFDRDHPLSSERIQALEQKLKSDPAWSKPTDPALEARFQRVKAKLIGLRRPEAGGYQISRERPERARHIMRVLMPTTSAAIRTKPCPKPTRSSRPTRTIPFSSN